VFQNDFYFFAAKHANSAKGLIGIKSKKYFAVFSVFCVVCGKPLLSTGCVNL